MLFVTQAHFHALGGADQEFVEQGAAVEALQRGDLGVQVRLVVGKSGQGLAGGDGLAARCGNEAGVGIGAAGHVAGGAPGMQQGVQCGALGAMAVALGKLLDAEAQGFGARAAQAHGLAQVAHPAAAAHGGQRLDCGQDFGVVGEFAVEVVIAQQQVADLFLRADTVGALVREAGAHGLAVAAAQVGGGGGGIEGDAAHAQAVQAEEFVGLAEAVLVQVFPELELGVGGVIGVEEGVAIEVEVGQGFEAVGGELPGAGAAREAGVVAKQFAAVVDAAIAVEVAHQNAFTGGDPAAGGFNAVAVVVEQDDAAAGVDGAGADAVAVEVQDEGVAGGRGPGEGAVGCNVCHWINMGPIVNFPSDIQ